MIKIDRSIYEAQFRVTEKEKDYVFVEIDSSKKTNLLSPAAVSNFQKLVEKYDGKVKVFLLSSANKNWSMGGDLVLEREIFNNRSELSAIEYASLLNNIREMIQKSKTLFIALINGHCHGGGVEFAFIFDIVYYFDQVNISLPEMRFGWPPGWGGVTEITKRLGSRRALNSCINITDIHPEEIGFIKIESKEKAFEMIKEEMVPMLTLESCYALKRLVYGEFSDEVAFEYSIEKNLKIINSRVDKFLER